MSVFFDLVILVVVGISIFNGWRLGLVKSVMGFASGILAFFAAVFFTPFLGSFICNNYVMPPISNEVNSAMSSLLNVSYGEEAYSTEKLFAEMPETLSNMLDRFNIDKDEFVEKFSSKLPTTSDMVKEMSDAIAEPVAKTVSMVTAFILIFVVAVIILKIVTIVIGIVVELPALKQLNEVFGLVFGVLAALFYAIVLSNAFVYLSDALSVYNASMFPADLIDKTYLVRLFSELRLSMLADIITGIRNV